MAGLIPQGTVLKLILLTSCIFLSGCLDEFLTIPIQRKFSFNLNISQFVTDYEQSTGSTLADPYPAAAPPISIAGEIYNAVQLSSDPNIAPYLLKIHSVEINNLFVHINGGNNSSNHKAAALQIWIGSRNATTTGNQGGVFHIADIEPINAGSSGDFMSTFVAEGINAANKHFLNLDFKWFIKNLLTLSGGEPKPEGEIQGQLVINLVFKVRL